MALMGELVRLASGVLLPVEPRGGTLSARQERAIRQPIVAEEVRATQAVRTVENVSISAMESGAEICRIGSQLAGAVPESQTVVSLIATEAAYALGSVVRASARRLGQ